MNFLDSTGLEHFYNKIKQKFIRSVNSQTPDSDGNVTITNVAAADNLISPDAQTSYDNFIYRTSGGSASISNGEAQLIYIDGNVDIIGRVYENFNIDAENNIVIEYDSQTWRSQISLTGEYTFNYLRPSSSVATSSWAPSLGTWTYNNSTVSLSTYGLTSSNVFAPSLSIVVTGSNIRSPRVVPNTWMGIIENGGTYDFIYDGSDWTLNGATVTLLNYGITVTGTPDENDTITVSYYSGTPNSDVVINYTAPEQGTILVAKPTAFSSTGFNQFNSSSMYISNATITTGEITSNSGTYIAYCHAKGGVTNGYVAYSRNGYIRNIGWCATVPTIGASVVTTAASVSNTLASIPFDDDGYVVVVVTNLSDLCIHPKWSGAADTEYQEYAAPSTISLPTVDVEGNTIPLGSYGMPAIGQVADRLNLEAGVYIQNIGRYAYSSSNLEIVQALGVEYDYDSNNIFYVLDTPVTYSVNISSIYIVNDFGTEEFLGTPVSVKAYMLYGQNLRDKLRTDVLTISQQTPPLSENQRQQVLSNIGISNISNPNLLDNWYFVGGGSQLGEGVFPINQRGQTSYSDSEAYTIDRWKQRGDNISTSFNLTENGVVIPSGTAASGLRGYFQTIASPKKLKGKTVTLSALVTNVSGIVTIALTNAQGVQYGTELANTTCSTDGIVTLTTTIPAVLSEAYLNVFVGANSNQHPINSSFTLQAIKLEIGSTQTLAHQENGTWVPNEIPNYTEQIYRCETSTADSSDPYANKKMCSQWQRVTGIQENVSFQLSSWVTEVLVRAKFSSGQWLGLYTTHTTSSINRVDSGFYYTSVVNGAGAMSFSVDRKVLVYHPYFAGSQTTFEEIQLFVR